MNWLIKLLGGYTQDEVKLLKELLEKAKKNDYRDSKGRFAKRPK